MEGLARPVKTKARYWLFGGALVALTVWWPLVGFVEGLFWGKTFDAKGLDDLAVDGILAAHPGLDSGLNMRFRDIPEVDGRDCLRDLDLIGMKAPKGTWEDNDAYWVATAIHRERNNRYYHDAYLQSLESLKAMGNPALGALQGCIEGSLLARMCDGYAVRRVTASLDSHRGEFSTRLAESETRAQNAACAALDGSFRKSRP